MSIKDSFRSGGTVNEVKATSIETFFFMSLNSFLLILLARTMLLKFPKAAPTASTPHKDLSYLHVLGRMGWILFMSSPMRIQGTAKARSASVLGDMSPKPTVLYD